MGRRIVPITPSTGFYRSSENEKRKHHIQFNKNNNLQNKMVEQAYHKVLSTVVNKLLHPFFGGLDSARSSLQTALLGLAHVQEM